MLEVKLGGRRVQRTERGRLELVSASRIELQCLHEIHFGELRGALAVHYGELGARHARLLLVEIGNRARAGVDVGLDLLLECRLRGQILALHLQLLLLLDQHQILGSNGEGDGLARTLQVARAGVAD